jgi:hypothetical protein
VDSRQAVDPDICRSRRIPVADFAIIDLLQRNNLPLNLSLALSMSAK